jgi:hypothetical protein
MAASAMKKEGGKYWELRNQKYTYDEVKGKLPQLQKGMAKAQVMIILGSPAQSYEDLWVYLPDRPAFYVPGEGVVIEFENGRYTKHRFGLIILGNPVIK